MSVLAEPKVTDHHDCLPLQIRNLTLRAGEHLLLEDVSATAPAGKVTLIVGCSGVGKSLLLKSIAGLIGKDDPGVHVRGDISFGEEDDLGRDRQQRIGIVFQQFALFDELSPSENVQIARDHARSRSDDSLPEDLLNELQVPRHRHTSLLSGGQRQRLAIARALAYNAPVLLYDEPTSGLDTVTAQRVAKRIRQTNDLHNKTSIVVTHDFESLLPIADEVWIVDPRSRALCQVPGDQWGELHDLLAAPASESLSDKGPSNGMLRLKSLAGDFFANTTRIVEELMVFPARLLPLWRSPYWGVRFLLHYLRLVAGPTACVYLLISGAIIGFVATYFTFRFLPYASYTKPLLLEDLLHSMGFALYRVLVPLLATLLIAARCGAAVASDVGAKSYGNQLDAMRSLSIPPKRYLLTPILFSFLIGVPLLTWLGYVASAFASVVVFSASHPELGPDFWNLHFHKLLVVPGQSLYDGTPWLLAKLLICAAGTAMIAYYQGARPMAGSSSVSRAITSTILWATLFVLVVHFGFAFYEFE